MEDTSSSPTVRVEYWQGGKFTYSHWAPHDSSTDYPRMRERYETLKKEYSTHTWRIVRADTQEVLMYEEGTEARRRPGATIIT